MRRTSILLAGVGLVASLLVTACGGNSSSGPDAGGTLAPGEKGLPPGEYQFGYVGPLTGAVAFAGIGVRDGIEAAFKEVNDSGRLGNGVKLVLKSEDDANEQAKGIAATQTLLNDEKVLGLLCCVSSSVTGSVKPLIDAKGMPSIITTAVLEGATSGKAMFRPRPDQVAMNTQLVEAAVKAFAPKTALVVVNSDNDGTAAIGKRMAADLEGLGVKLLPTVSMLQDDSDMSGPSTTIIAAKPDLVFHAENGQNIAMLVRELASRGFAGHNIGTNALVDAAIFKVCGKACVGVPYVDTYFPDPTNPSPFMKEWLPYAQKATGEDLPSSWFASGQTAALMVIDALEKYSEDHRGDRVTRDTLRSSFADIGTFDTPMGAITIGSDGQGTVDDVLLMQLNSNGEAELWDGTPQGLASP